MMTRLPDVLIGRRGALVIAHPGHELRVHGWLEAARPAAYVLTDGSGHTGVSRLTSTTCLLEAAGASRGAVYGRYTDGAIYQAVLHGAVDHFLTLSEELSEVFREAGIDYVVSDAEEGYNPSHDLCRWVAGAAVRKATVPHFDFPLVAHPQAHAGEPGTLSLDLPGEALDRKLEAARGYAALAAETEAALREHGREPFRRECLRACREGGHPLADPPYYETYGERQVAAGIYGSVLRYREHMLPLYQALRANGG